MRRVLSTVAMVALVSSSFIAITRAQGPAAMTAERSRQVLSIVKAVEDNKSAAVNQLLSEWQSQLNPDVYDIHNELYARAMAAPAWQLYGAALTGDLKTMGRILRGSASAGHYINSLSTPQLKTAAGFDGPQLLGDSASDLVFTPIAPCRVVDTRGSGARTGVIPANGTRSFDLEDDAYGAGQGGATSGCTGLPVDSPPAWAINITVTNGYVAAGGLKAWGFSTTEPNASVINFTPANSGGIANGLSIIGCNLCGDDLTVRAFGDATHVIIDVVGYYAAAPVSNAATTRVVGTVVNVPANSGAFATGGACPAGTSLVGGELDHGSGGDAAIGEFTSVGSSWRFWFKNNTAGAIAVTPYSRCIDTPIQQ